MKFQNILSTIISVLFIQCVLGAKCKGKAKFELKIKYLWTSQNFKNVPSSAHFSQLVVHSHSARYSAYSRFGYATQGVQNVAETGSTVQLKNELEKGKQGKMVSEYVIDNRFPDGGDQISTMITVSCKHRYISSITMVAPSPDWILPIFRLKTVKKDNFINSTQGSIQVYDAGTDSGKTLTAPNEKTTPKQNIARLTGAPFFGKQLATYSLERIN